jgi:gluconate 2-dehydrogenase gamma chain
MAGQIDRRRLIAAGALGAVPAIAAAATYRGAEPWESRAAAPRAAQAGVGWLYFTAPEAAFVQAACVRMIPSDELGPGAVEAGVPEFIDRQLAGEFGRATHWYMQGPWAKGEKTQGYQSRYTPAGFYRAALKSIDEAVGRQTSGKTFAGLAGADQDAFLKSLEAGKADLQGVDGKAFFDMFHQNVLEGFWSDPIYGGNRGMAGWKLIGFPGAHYDQRPFVKTYGQPYPLPPVGIKGRPEWSQG